MILDLGSLTPWTSSTARDVNSAGVVVGYALTTRATFGSESHAMRWTVREDGRVQVENLMPLLSPSPTAAAYAFGINDAGVIVGGIRLSERDTMRAFALDGGAYRDLHDARLCTGGSWNGNFSYARDVNARGEVVGVLGTFGVSENAFVATLEKGCIVQLPSLGGSSEARSINDASVIVGWSAEAPGGTKHPVAWSKSSDDTWVIRTLGSESAEAWAVNAFGEAAGALVEYDEGGERTYSLAWTREGRTSGRPLTRHRRARSAAYGISDAGLVVGWSEDSSSVMRPVFWTRAGARDLGTLGGARGAANAISGRWIVGHSETSGAGGVVTSHATVWRVP